MVDGVIDWPTTRLNIRAEAHAILSVTSWLNSVLFARD